MSKWFRWKDSPKTNDGTPIRYAILSDRPLVRVGFCAAVSDDAHLECCGEADAVEALWTLMESKRPQVVVVDLNLADGQGLQSLREISERCAGQSRVLLIAPNDEPLLAGMALEAGALGFVTDRDSVETLVGAMHRVSRGLIHLNERLTSELLGQSTTSKVVRGMRTLTERELEVFRLIGHGETTRGIARRLELSPHTIETYRERIRQKLGLANGSDLAFRAIVWNLLHGA